MCNVSFESQRSYDKHLRSRSHSRVVRSSIKSYKPLEFWCDVCEVACSGKVIMSITTTTAFAAAANVC